MNYRTRPSSTESYSFINSSSNKKIEYDKLFVDGNETKYREIYLFYVDNEKVYILSFSEPTIDENSIKVGEPSFQDGSEWKYTLKKGELNIITK